MLSVAVIGAGYMGRAHCRVISELSSIYPIQLSAVVDVDFEKARRLAKQYNVKAYSNVDDLEEHDIVVVATTTSSHHVVVERVASKTSYLFVEKPLADTIEHGERIIEVCSRYGVKGMVGYIERFNPVVRALLREVKRGTLGNIISIIARRVGPYIPRIRDIGVVLDLATHDIDIAHLIYGSWPKSVYAHVEKVVNEVYEDSAVIVLEFERGRVAVIEANRITPFKERKLIVTGTKAVAYLDYLNQNLTIYTPEWTMESNIAREEPLKVELREFIESALYNREPPVPLSDGLKLLEIGYKALKSSKT
ncbi:MAG TPA: Gfo/Idh/MocA family oxidoreductase [Desulfurococcales archaeon]|nr:Gfo/Idh/MocA family oxidoreductase [Desulfurococcales archaeon]